ncbi:PREDICTED: uncharacterized protein LOC104803397 [Tarenaya hassleriana]|uniref:uncharacterized protein LOC104803397 n=1 Tax=Tarenaya hassleriana TaxID=28532 RepID=UPI00053CA9A2|nr:PREDICTED: uncharacterized protein LOC104803397 [Tarenaya hassleriana]
MELQALCFGLSVPRFGLSTRNFVSHPPGSSRYSTNQSFRLRVPSRHSFASGFRDAPHCALSLNRGGVICLARSESDLESKNLEKRNIRDGAEPFRGKPGSISFQGLTHQLVEESKLVSGPFQEEKGSFLWVLAPVALISSLILPQFFLSGAIEVWFKNDILIEIVASICFEAMFYAGLATFLSVTDRVQRPYLDFSSKRWGLITGLRGYLSSAFLAMGLKVVVPLFALYMNWPALGIDALIAVLPFLVGCAVQRAFEAHLERRGSSCWPVVPIIFEVYRMYQLTRAATFIQRLMFLLKDAPSSPVVAERGVALVGMVVSFQFLAIVCLWSLITFLLRLFPSRPVAENY